MAYLLIGQLRLHKVNNFNAILILNNFIVITSNIETSRINGKQKRVVFKNHRNWIEL